MSPLSPVVIHLSCPDLSRGNINIEQFTVTFFPSFRRGPPLQEGFTMRGNLLRTVQSEGPLGFRGGIPLQDQSGWRSSLCPPTVVLGQPYTHSDTGICLNTRSAPRPQIDRQCKYWIHVIVRRQSETTSDLVRVQLALMKKRSVRGHPGALSTQPCPPATSSCGRVEGSLAVARETCCGARTQAAAETPLPSAHSREDAGRRSGSVLWRV